MSLAGALKNQEPFGQWPDAIKPTTVLQAGVDTLKVRDFYAGKTILITGCTGFLGKMLLEKLMRSCDVRRIYIMIRAKKGMTLEGRLEEEIYQSELFQEAFYRDSTLRARLQQVVQPIPGDIGAKNLGLSA
jgi:alcohol-forming fatty acyl-CoA reductase